jgi:ATP-dependent exoDNAse (exonuclease V) beta subunit
MNSRPSDQAARDRFTREGGANLAVVANAGSGKTTAISERLAELALAADGAEVLRQTAVVTYTKKAAAQIGQKARSVLLRRMEGAAPPEVDPLARLDRVFFGTIHSFCLLLARRHGSTLGVHLNPTLVDADDEGAWQEFLEQDPMTFTALSERQVGAFLRFAPLDQIFDLARDLEAGAARRLRAAVPAGSPPPPDPAALAAILALPVPKRADSALRLARNQDRASEWVRLFAAGEGRLPIAVPDGEAGGIDDLFRRLYAPLKAWLADAGGALAGELSLRYKAWREERGIQTYADQIETALAVLRDPGLLERIRAEGWRVILDEAQDTDPQQFAVLVEITRPPGAPVGTWPRQGGVPPRPGHFCMVGDAQQGIYSDRADILNFQDHVDAFARGDGGERLAFDVTFRAPHRVVALLNATLPAAFGPDRPHNFGLPPAKGAAPRFMQVRYEPLVAGPDNRAGAAILLPFDPAPPGPRKGAADRKLEAEGRQLAALLRAGGPAAVGAGEWGDICILAPRSDWLRVVRDQLEKAGLKTALQMRRNRSGDNPAYAWVTGLLAVVCDPDNAFEWVGVLREVFAVSDAEIAAALSRHGTFRWDEPDAYPAPVAEALGVLLPFIGRADGEGDSLLAFATELSVACGLGARALRLDPEGGLGDELDRLLARAAELGTAGGGPRAWLQDLLGSLEGFRASGRPAGDAINLITCHSAKGLEWPVVIPVGLWRSIGFQGPKGLRLVAERPGFSRVVFDSTGVDDDTKESLRRAQQRELVRLLYVTLTRPEAVLAIPWCTEAPEKASFATLWGLDPAALEPRSAVGAEAVPGRREAGAPGPPPAPAPDPPPGGPAPPFPRRVLPHQLAGVPADGARSALHEASLDLPLPVREDAADPLEYGIWWHETLEFVPWAGGAAAVSAHGEAALARAAAKGFGERGRQEWDRFLASPPWTLLDDRRWTRRAEVGVFAPLAPGEWIDGVIDLVLHDPAARELWIVDWKTNRRRPGESDPALLARLAAEYEPQLRAYGTCAGAFFGQNTVRLWVYSTVAGQWAAVGSPAPGGTP